MVVTHPLRDGDQQVLRFEDVLSHGSRTALAPCDLEVVLSVAAMDEIPLQAEPADAAGGLGLHQDPVAHPKLGRPVDEGDLARRFVPDVTARLPAPEVAVLRAHRRGVHLDDDDVILGYRPLPRIRPSWVRKSLQSSSLSSYRAPPAQRIPFITRWRKESFRKSSG